MVALDYYLSGVKIDSTHIGCVYNIACCHYSTNKFCNAEKWFKLAIQVHPGYQDSYVGLTMTCLRLGKYLEAYQSI